MATVLVYENRGFTGKVASFPVGEYKDKYALEAMGIGKDVIGSMKIPAGLKVIAYEKGNFDGYSQEYTGDVSDVGKLNDDIDSMKVIAIKGATTTGAGSDTGNSGSDSDKGKKISVAGWIAISIGGLAFLGGLTFFVIKAFNKNKGK